MYNLYAILKKYLNIYKLVVNNFINKLENEPTKRVIPNFLKLRLIVTLNMTSEAISINWESSLFAKLLEYKRDIQYLISRR